METSYSDGTSIKITIIHGQNHKGSTYHIARMLAEKIGGDITEYFLPRDFGEFCVGCANCFRKNEELCPHYKQYLPIRNSLDEADIIILASPVYVYHVTGPMKSFLDHFGYRWMVHRPQESMFKKQAVCISTAAGAGMKSTNKDMKDSLFFWGVAKVYTLGMAVRAVDWNAVSDKNKQVIEKKTDRLAKILIRRNGSVVPGLKTRCLFGLLRLVQGKSSVESDASYWRKKGWLGKKRPWK